MKNLIFVFIAAVLLVLTSCSKENLDLPIPQKMESTIAKNRSVESANTPQASVTQTTVTREDASITIRLQVSEVSSFQTATEYSVGFSGNYDFRNVEIAASQSLKFTDANGNISNLTFSVNATVRGDGTLDIDFAKGNHVLTGLSLAAAQEIIVEDWIMN